MIDIEIEDQLVEKVGGKLHLTALMQKRLVELKRGDRPLIATREKNHLKIVVEEILGGMIELGSRGDCDTSFLDEAARKRKERENGEPEREILGSDIKKIKEQRIRELSALLNPTKK